uniref:Uncharacterized protein n=1 Tax=Panagrolaimus sp. ES5 TaxID=591445 RepID=A0AC34F7C1_9BILA
MIAYFLVITFCFINSVWSFGFDLSVSCYHGESQNNKSTSVVMKCPSMYCLKFTVICNDYMAVTCYNESDPMSLFKAFPTAMKHYKNDPETAIFESCRWTKCNAFNNTENFISIPKPPTTFDQFLSTKVPKEKPYRELQNKIRYVYSQQENETYKVIFDTVKTSKLAWISLDLRMKDNSTVRRKFDIDFVNGKVKLLKWIQQSNFTKPGGKLNFTIEYTTEGTNIFINEQFFQSLDKKVTDILYLTYGGEMVYSNGTSTTFGPYGYDLNLGDDSPEFHSNLIPAKKQVSTKIVNSPKLNVTSINWEEDTSYILIPMISLKSFEKLNVELRADYKVNSNLVKIQVQAISSNTTTSNDINYHVIIWSRNDNNWNTYGKVIVKNCKKPNLFLTSGYASFYCDNKSKFSAAIYTEITNDEIKNFYCNAKVQKFTCLK